MSKSNLAVKEELNDVVGEEAILQETTINNINIIKKEKTNKKVLYKFTKRIIDIIGSIIGILILIPTTSLSSSFTAKLLLLMAKHSLLFYCLYFCSYILMF